LWFTILIQGVFTAYSIWLFIQSFITGVVLRRYVFVIAAALLSVASSLPVKTGILLPDFFTATALLLSAVLLLRSENVSRQHIALAFAGTVLSCLMHHSNVYILFAMLVLLLLLKWRKRSYFPHTDWKRVLFFVALFPTWWLSAGLINKNYGNDFFVSRNGDIFLAGHFVHDGTMRKFLCVKCEKEKYYPMCKYKDSLSGLDFLWDQARSPLHRYGGWERSNGIFGLICKDIISTPRLWPWLTHRALGQSAEQFCSFYINSAFEAPGGIATTPVEYSVGRYYNNELNQFQNSQQYNSGLKLDAQNERQNILLFFSTGALILFVFGYRKSHTALVGLFIYLGVAMYSNALICGAISIVNPRYQTRVMWLLPLFVIVVLAQSGIFATAGERLKKFLS
jgi:hypothetical protein